MSYTRELLYSIADEMGRNRKDMDQFIQSLQKNWYDSKQSLRTLTIQDYDKFQIPSRLSSVIMKKIGADTQKNSSNNYQFKQNTQQGSMMDIEQSVRQYIGQLKKSVNKEIFTLSINTLVQIFRNIRENLSTQKFRTLKKSNQKIGQLLTIKQNHQILVFGGFQDKGNILIMNQLNLSTIDQCLDQLLKHHQSSKFNPYEAVIINTNTNNKPPVSGETSVKYNDMLKQLEDQRMKIMSKPVSNRDIKVYQLTQGQLKPDASWNEDRDFTIQQKQYNDSIKQKLRHFGEDAIFINRRKQEYIQLAKKPVFSETVARIKLPDNWVFECKFSPLETLGDLVRIFHEFVENKNLSYYLYMTPPVEKLFGANLRNTFYDQGCVPKSIFYLGSDQPIKGNILRAKKGGYNNMM